MKTTATIFVLTAFMFVAVDACGNCNTSGV
jgi:hypothetical protein